METLVNKSLQTLIKPNCTLCGAILQTPQSAKAHYGSKRHIQNVSLYRDSAKKMFNPNMQEQLEQSTQKNVKFVDKTESNEDLYCKICMVGTTSKDQMWSHLKGAPHQAKIKQLGLPQIDGRYTPFCNNLPKDLREQLLVDTCCVCNKSFSTIKTALSHYLSPRHDAAVGHWFKEKRQIEKQSKQQATIMQKEVKPQIMPEPTICYLCAKSLGSKLERDKHLKCFPHADLAKVKSYLIKQGVMEEFWYICGPIVNCALCNCNLFNSNDMDTHFNDLNHCEKYIDWCMKLPANKVILETDSKWYYCKICDKEMDGTNGSELHYVYPSHLKRSELYCQVCEVRHSTKELLEHHNTTNLHLENLKLGLNTKTKFPAVKQCDFQTDEAEKTKKTDNDSFKVRSSLVRYESEEDTVPAINSEALEPTSSSNESEKVKEQVFNELDKLIQKLYYSKTVPYDEALKYLKQVNKEVENLSKTFNKNEDISEASTKYDKKDVVEIPENNLAGLTEARCLNPLVDKDEVGAIDSLDVDSDLLINSNENILASTSFNNKLSGHEQKNKEKLSLPSADPCAVNNLTSFNEVQTIINTKDISDLLNQIVERKLEVQRKYPNEQTVEKEVLSEIEILIRQIDRGGIPLKETLRCLENFNKQLDAKDVSVGEEVLDDKQGYKSDIPGKQEPRYNYSKEELIKMRTNDTYEMATLQLPVQIEVKQPRRAHIKDYNCTKATDCQTSIYDYYLGNNFNNFMDFLELYLQGSIEDCKAGAHIE